LVLERVDVMNKNAREVKKEKSESAAGASGLTQGSEKVV
jgi:hypothetical protein